MHQKLNIPQLLENEILAVKISTKDEKKAFLNGVLTGSGYLFKSEAKSGIIIETSNFKLAQKTSTLINHIANYSPAIYENKIESNLNDKIVYTIEIENDKAIEILMYSGHFDNQINTFENIKIDNLKNDISKKAFLQGLYATSGSIYVPDDTYKRSGGYNLEIIVKNLIIAKDVKSLLKHFGIESNSRNKNNNIIVYIKDSENISDFLIVINAVSTFFKLQNTLAYRSITNYANRERNCLVANISKTADASAKQLQAIQILRESGKFDKLNDKLKATALARLQYPDLALSELANEVFDKPSKSGLAHRLNRIIEIANKEINRDY